MAPHNIIDIFQGPGTDPHGWIMLQTLNVNLTLFVIPCKKVLYNTYFQCCTYYHLLRVFPSKFQLSMTIIYYKNVRMWNIPKVDELTIPWDYNIYRPCHVCASKCG